MLVPAPSMVADALIKNYGPLTHWRRISYLLGESPELSRLRDIVLQKYSKSKRLPTIPPEVPTDNNYDEDITEDIGPTTTTPPITTSPTASTSLLADGQ